MGLVFVHLALSGLCLGVHRCYMLVHIIFGRTTAQTKGGDGQGCGGENGGSYSLHRCLSRCPLPVVQSCGYSVAEMGCFGAQMRASLVACLSDADGTAPRHHCRT